MRRASMAMRRTIVRQTPGPSMCSRGPLGSGLSRPISKPRIPMLGTGLGRASVLTVIRSWSERGLKPVPRAGSMPIKPTIVRQTPEPSMCSRVPLESGLNRPISKPRTLEQTRISAVAWQSREISWPLAHRLEDSNATGINGDQGNSNAPDSGAVYLFTRSGGVWTQKAYLKASNSNAGDEFGEVSLFLAIRLAVGAPLKGVMPLG